MLEGSWSLYVRPIDPFSTNDLKSDMILSKYWLAALCVLPAGTFIPKKSPSNVRSVGRASVSPGLWLSTKHYTCRSRNWSQPRSNDSLCQQGKDGDTVKTRPKTTTVKGQPKTFSSQLLEVEPSASMEILFKDEIFHQPLLKENNTEINLDGEVYA